MNTKLYALLKAFNLPLPKAEHQFCKKRRFAFDYAWVDFKIALEVEGGIYTRQAHGSVTGIIRDIEKYNLAALYGWKVLRIPADRLISSYTVEIIKNCFNKNIDELVLKELYGNKRKRAFRFSKSPKRAKAASRATKGT